MKINILIMVVFALAGSAAVAHAEDSHDHNHEQEHHHGEENHGDEHEDETGREEEISSNVGPGFAVIEAQHDRGFKLSEKAHKTLGLELRKIQGTSVLTVPAGSLVFFKDEVGVYRVRDGWIKLIEGETETRGATARFNPKEKSAFKPGDQIVTAGVPLLRVTELDAFSGSEAGHAH